LSIHVVYDVHNNAIYKNILFSWTVTSFTSKRITFFHCDPHFFRLVVLLYSNLIESHTLSFLNWSLLHKLFCIYPLRSFHILIRVIWLFTLSLKRFITLLYYNIYIINIELKSNCKKSLPQRQDSKPNYQYKSWESNYIIITNAYTMKDLLMTWIMQLAHSSMCTTYIHGRLRML